MVVFDRIPLFLPVKGLRVQIVPSSSLTQTLLSSESEILSMVMMVMFLMICYMKLLIFTLFAAGYMVLHNRNVQNKGKCISHQGSII